MGNYPVSLVTAECAVAYIDPHNRDVWVRVGQALKAEFGEDGFALFDSWSAGAANYDAKAVRSVWRGFKSMGGVSIGTLIYEAKVGGFDPKKQSCNLDASGLNNEARAAREKHKADAMQIEEAKTAAKHEAAAIQARAIWQDAQVSGESPYLGIKGVGAHGVRFASVGGAVSVLVPVCDVEGVIYNLQTITDKGVKRFVAGGRVSGLFHLLGQVVDGGWLLVSEGYATAATLFENLGLPCVAAFNAHNLKRVCEALRVRYPLINILVCADNDIKTELKTGSNVGLLAAYDAAKSVAGVAVVAPQGLPDGLSDFNDLANYPHIGGGVLQVIEQVRGAMEAVALKAGAAVDGGVAPAIVPAESRDDKGRFKSLKKGFTLNDEGVWWQGFAKNGSDFVAKPLLWVCSALRVVANTYANERGGQGYLLEFVDMRGIEKRWVMPAHMLSGDGQAYRKELLDMGLRIGAGNEVRTKLTEYIQGVAVDEWVRCTEAVGWFGDAYVLPDRVVGNSNGERVIYQSTNAAVESQIKQMGTLDEWRDYVAALCEGNTRLMFAVCTAFAGFLVEPSGVESAGFHLMGGSRTGKSTALYAACSVLGARDYKKSWKATGTAMEAMAAQYNDALLVLDEIGEVDGRIVGDVVYMLGNGTGKGRGNVGVGLRHTLKWRVLYLSTGEKTLSALMNESGKAINAGQEARLINIPADAGRGLGVFDVLNGYASGHDLAQDVDFMTRSHYGVAGALFLDWCVDHIKMLRSSLRGEVQDLAKVWASQGGGVIDGQVISVAMRFALVAVAGEKAGEAGLTGWQKGAACEAVKACFDAWIMDRGGWGNSEVMAMMAQVRGWFVANGEARFTSWHRAVDDHKPNTANRAGFKRFIKGGKPYAPPQDIEEKYANLDNVLDYETYYYVMPEVFKNELCKGFNHKAVAALLSELGIIERGKDSFQKPVKLPTIGLTRCYQFTPKLFETEL